MISQYTNLTFKYVECEDWEDAMERLACYEIDLLGTVGLPLEREQQYAICDTSYSYSIIELAALPESNFVFEDHEELNITTIGYVEGDSIYGALTEIQEKEGMIFRPELMQRELH